MFTLNSSCTNPWRKRQEEEMDSVTWTLVGLPSHVAPFSPEWECFVWSLLSWEKDMMTLTILSMLSEKLSSVWKRALRWCVRLLGAAGTALASGTDGTSFTARSQRYVTACKCPIVMVHNDFPDERIVWPFV